VIASASPGSAAAIVLIVGAVACAVWLVLLAASRRR